MNLFDNTARQQIKVFGQHISVPAKGSTERLILSRKGNDVITVRIITCIGEYVDELIDVTQLKCTQDGFINEFKKHFKPNYK